MGGEVGVRRGLDWGEGTKYISTCNLACPYAQAPAKTLGVTLHSVSDLLSPLEKRPILKVNIILLALFIDDNS